MARWLGKTPVPDVAALNMHYDQYRALPALGSATNSLADLYTAKDDVATASSLSRHVVFTDGCHSALGIPDLYAPTGDERAFDFAQAYGSKGTAVMIGNYGFGYADTARVAYSSRLQAIFAGLIDEAPLGTALTLAKRRYISTLSSLSPYDLKSVSQMVLWGIPQYRLPGVTEQSAALAASAVGPSSLTADPLTGLPSSSISVGTSTNALRFAGADGSVVFSGGNLTPPPDDGTPRYVTAASTDPGVADHDPQTVSASGHPVLAAQFTELPARTDTNGNLLVPRSVVPRALNSTPTYATTSEFAQAGTDHAIDLGESSEGEYPSTLGHLWTVPTGGSWQSTFVMTPQQVFLDGTAPGHGRTRLFPRSDWTVLYGLPGAARPDTITKVQATRNVSTTRYDVDVIAATGAQTKVVYALALGSSGAGDWVLTRLSPDASTPGRWTGQAPGRLGAFMVVATNSLADTAVSTLKGLGWEPLDVVGTDEFANLLLPDPTGIGGWYTTTPTATTSNGYRLSVDGAPVSTPYAFTDGEHLARLQRPDGTWVPGHLEVRVDTVVPQVQITIDGQPADSAASFPDDSNLHHLAWRTSHPVSVSVVAGPSGYSLTTQGTAPLGEGLQVDTSALGAPTGGRELSATATSGAGLSGTSTWLYRVVYGSAGFVAPVAESNVVLSLLAYQYSFRMHDGLGQEATTAQPGSTFLATWAAGAGCGTGSINLPSLSGAGAAPSYSSGAWRWNLKAPAAGCQELRIRLNDGYTSITTLAQVLL